jgi:hypothetical protein
MQHVLIYNEKPSPFSFFKKTIDVLKKYMALNFFLFNGQCYLRSIIFRF